jgi:phosphatidylethanolamine-binding protein (PEBP) family uncharacterized protein
VGRLRARPLLSLMVPAIGLLLGGCGSSGTSPTTSSSTGTASSSSKTTNTHTEASPEISLHASLPIPLRTAEQLMSATYTCDGANISPPVSWQTMPPGTAEVALFAISVRPVHGRLFFDWAVMGLSPHSHGVKTGALPAGAVAGLNSSGKVGYSFCPERRPAPEHMIIRVIALKRTIPAKPGFNAEALYQRAEQNSLGIALTGAGYLRR